jgi:superfamily II DNA/RNA helicase
LHEAPFPELAIEICRQKGFTMPTPIQAQVWPLALLGGDIVEIAETGSGRKLAYVLPMIKHVTGQLEVLPGDGPIGLVVVPSRELCQQIAHVVSEHARYEPDKVIMSMVQADQGAQFVILAIRATENIVEKIVAVAASHSMRMNARGVYSLLMRVANVHRASASPGVLIEKT